MIPSQYEDSISQPIRVSITAIAESLAKSHYRFITDTQIGALRRKYSASRDEIRCAAILADRLRRQRQLDNQWNTFIVSPLIPPDAPIALPKEQRLRRASSEANISKR
ncbi:hypothetical protein [Rhizobium leguminosarum]|uniref:hypothetical protein n=1 Tax=Rhizobium leguminosarum TaxID=384 RepID=UPI001C93E1FA|nr:hypothetical protein [Rhizobium leguminosarum]MBY5316152.1 hypothetical protein [Rhizobium leguminosarum]